MTAHAAGDAPRARLRGDLQVVVQQEGARQTLLVDTIARRYVRLDAARWDQLRCLNVPGAAVDPHLVAEAGAAGLLCGSRRQPAPRWRLAGLLAIRLPGIPVDRLADWLAGRSGWLFSPVAVACWAAVILAAGLAIPVYWDRFHAHLPGLQAFLASDNWGPLLLTLATTKLLHELAHATVCRRSGARCGPIGILLLCGIPCPYCDVTDSWRIASPLRRAAIMLAGVYVEWVLAALASLVWWCTSDGGLHYAAMNVMVVCGVSTLLFNLNPLMRYDGYHVLSDLVGSVNLRQESADAFRVLITSRLAGPGYALPPARSPRIAGLAIYHLAATCYRALVAVLIALWMVRMADGLAIRSLGLLAGSGLMLAIPAGALRKIMIVVRGGGAWTGVARSRRVALAAAAGAALIAVGWLPLPHSIHARGVVDVADASAVYLPAAARVASVDADLGDRVQRGQRLLLLADPNQQEQAIALDGKAAVLRQRIVQLRRRAIDQPQLLRQWDTHQAALRSVETQRQTAQQSRDRLSVVAPRDGIVLPPPPATLRQDPRRAAALAARHDPDTAPPSMPPLNDRAASDHAARRLTAATGAWTTADAMWCRVGDPANLAVVLEVDAAQRRRVRVGNTVRVRCDQSPETVFAAVIASIDTVDRRQSDALSVQSRFRVACRLPADAQPAWRIGATATAQVRLPPQPLAARLLDWWQETFGGG